MVSNAALIPVDQTTQTPAQVYLRDSRAPADAGAAHAAGLRAPRADDDPTAPLYDAAGRFLAFTLEKWRAANGSIDITPADAGGAGDRITLTLHRLIAFGHYSVFIRSDSADGPHFAPLDGSGITNNFDAHEDGGATVAISTAQHVASGSWIVTIYHSDAQDHGNSPGDLTRTAQQQLMIKVP